jgi:hypothetical protein
MFSHLTLLLLQIHITLPRAVGFWLSCVTDPSNASVVSLVGVANEGQRG